MHQAISYGCVTCHTAVDASVLPHKITNRHPRGLSSKQKRLCYSCHEQAAFMKKNVHGAILCGCTSCHNPHSSEEAHLLKAGEPDLCMQCHDHSVVMAKTPHDAIGDTSCSTCHNAHATDGPKLLLTGQPADDNPALVKRSGD